MGFVLVMFVIAVGGAGYWFWRRKQGKPASRRIVAAPAAVSSAPPAAGPPRRPGRMINPGLDCCAAVRRIESAWYLEGNVPRLPLETCDHPQTCKCAWMRVVDRRATHRRDAHDRRGQVRFEDKSDRRTGGDRRSDAANPWKNT